MSEIVSDQVEDFLRGLLPERTGFLQQLEAEAKLEGVPIVQPEVGQLLLSLVRIKGARRILEVGTATGYSALWMAQGLGNGGTLTTIELDAGRAAQARTHFNQWFGSAGPVTLLEGDAREILPKLKGTYDLVFLDAAKGQYPEFLRQVESLLAPGGVLVADNVLFRGMVAQEDAQIPKRYRTLVRRLQEFLKVLSTETQWETTILPIGDGVLVSYKKD